MHPAEPRYPFAALVRFVGPVYQFSDRGQSSPNSDAHMKRIGELAHVTRRTLARWKREGIPSSQADHLAVSLGAHPCEIWPQWYDEDI